jgi:hypothetical protein
MKVEPTLDEVVNGDRGMLRGIEACLEAECLVSAVALIFAAIDALAALTRPKDAENTTSDVFKGWVESYVLPDSDLSCSASDLYGARCGILHTYNADSALSRKGAARKLIYHWRIGPLPDDKDGELLIEIEKLYGCFKAGVQNFMVAASTDSEIGDRVSAHLPSLLCYRPWPTIVGRVGV